MENPYEAPQSRVDTGGATKRSTWWKVYFFIISVLSFMGMGTFLLSEGAGIIDYIELLLLITATAGLYGFAFSKKVLFPKFWIPFLIFYLIAGVVYEPLSKVDMRGGMPDSEFYIGLIIGYIMSIPAYYGLYQYGNKNGLPWRNV